VVACIDEQIVIIKVSDRLQYLIQSAPQLAYRFALKTAGMKENDVCNDATALQRFSTLRNYTKCRRCFQLSYPTRTRRRRYLRYWQRFPGGGHRFTNVLSAQEQRQKPT